MSCTAIDVLLKVCTSDGATVVYTNKGDVLALYGYTTRKLGIRQHGIEKIQAIKLVFLFA